MYPRQPNHNKYDKIGVEKKEIGYMTKILLVEDDSNLREIYGARLEAEGYEISIANDGEEALAVAVKERPDLIISDIMMPKISGFDMLDILRSTPETKDVKVIVMTALSQEEDRARGEGLGADKYFVKSQVTLDDVVESVKELLSGKASAAVDGSATDPDDSVAASTATDDTVTLDDEVAEFAANNPLMNGGQLPEKKPEEDSEPEVSEDTKQ